MTSRLSSEDKMDVIRLFAVEKLAHDLRELRIGTRRHGRTHTMTYSVTCRSLWESYGEKSVMESAPSLAAAVAAVAAAAKAFTAVNNRSDWQVAWSAVCTVARRDDTWSLTVTVPNSEVGAFTPKMPAPAWPP